MDKLYVIYIDTDEGMTAKSVHDSKQEALAAADKELDSYCRVEVFEVTLPHLTHAHEAMVEW